MTAFSVSPTVENTVSSTYAYMELAMASTSSACHGLLSPTHSHSPGLVSCAVDLKLLASVCSQGLKVL
jgi:hypothetical protein